MIIQKLSLVCVGLFLTLLLLPMFFVSQKIENKIVKNDVFYLQPTWHTLNLTPVQQFYQIGRQLDYIALQNPQIRYIVLPESAFPYNLLDWENRLHAWTCLFDEQVSIFIGAHLYDKDKIYNCLYQIRDGKIVSWYNKQHLVPFVERIPLLFRCIPIFNGLFTDEKNVFSYPSYQQNNCGDEFEIFICSELFCEGKKPNLNVPILFVCNDSWFRLDFAKDLAKRTARLYSLRYKVSIVYVGSYDMEIIER